MPWSEDDDHNPVPGRGCLTFIAVVVFVVIVVVIVWLVYAFGQGIKG